jgi:hypothetical protein
MLHNEPKKIIYAEKYLVLDNLNDGDMVLVESNVLVLFELANNCL